MCVENYPEHEKDMYHCNPNRDRIFTSFLSILTYSTYSPTFEEAASLANSLLNTV